MPSRYATRYFLRILLLFLNFWGLGVGVWVLGRHSLPTPKSQYLTPINHSSSSTITSKSMKTTYYFIFMLSCCSLFLGSCTSDTIELLSPETKEQIQGEATRAVAIRLIFTPQQDQVWSNLVWAADGTWAVTTLGKNYPNPNNWLQITWQPDNYEFLVQLQHKVVDYSNPVLIDQAFCGAVEASEFSDTANGTIICFKLDADFVDCLEVRTDQIQVDLTILLN